MIYAIQILSILVAVFLARHDAPAVLHFEYHGVDNNSMAKFHRNNNFIKFVVCCLAACVFYPDIKSMFFAGLLSALWIYLLFDIVLNKNRPGKNWDYIGQNDADGRRWIKLFGQRAGEWKAILLFALIVITNILKIVL